MVQKPIKFKVCRPEQEPEDFISKIHQETIDEEVEEEPAETLIQHSKKWDRKQRAEAPAPTVVVETQDQKEPENEQHAPPIGQPEPNKERVLSPGLSLRQL